MLEQKVRQKVVAILRPLDAFSVENSVYPGTPDVNYIGGWIELKQIARWPDDLRHSKRKILLVPEFSPQQRAWLARRRQRGGRAHLLLHIGLDWLLFDGARAAACLGLTWTKEDCLRNAERVWLRNLNATEFLEHMRG